jgi:hypothetical protein
MRKFRLIALLVVTALLVGLAAADDKPKTGGDKPKAGALPPSPLDDAFARANTERGITNGLLNNEQFKRAVKAALKAKKDQEQWFKAHPDGVNSTPAQAAREAFLKTLQEMPKDAPKEGKKEDK